MNPADFEASESVTGSREAAKGAEEETRRIATRSLAFCLPVGLLIHFGSPTLNEGL